MIYIFGGAFYGMAFVLLWNVYLLGAHEFVLQHA